MLVQHWWKERNPLARLVLRASFKLGKPIDSCELKQQNKQNLLMVVTSGVTGQQYWRITSHGKTLASEPVKMSKIPEAQDGPFDFDRDGYPDDIHFTYPHGSWDENLHLYVFKHRESLPRSWLKQLPYKPDLVARLTEGQEENWVLWSDIPMDESLHNPQMFFIIEPDPKQPRKVVLWAREGSHGGSYWLLSPDGKKVHSFAGDLWDDPKLEDLDHDGAYELIVSGRGERYTAKVVYKWDGHTYREFWTSWEQNSDAIHAKMQDIDDDGIKEIVATLNIDDDKGSRQLAVYKLDHGRCRKVAVLNLPHETYRDYPVIKRILPLRDGHLIVLQTSRGFMGCLYRDGQLQKSWRRNGGFIVDVPGDWDGNDFIDSHSNWDKYEEEGLLIASDDGKTFVVDLLDEVRRWTYSLPVESEKVEGWQVGKVVKTSKGQDIFFSVAYRHPSPPSWQKILPAQVRKCLKRERSGPFDETFVISYDGNRLRLSQKLGSEIDEIEAYGKEAQCVWMVAKVTTPQGTSGETYAVFVKKNGRYREIWREQFHATPRFLSADLDGDGQDELIVVESEDGKVRVFGIE